MVYSVVVLLCCTLYKDITRASNGYIHDRDVVSKQKRLVRKTKNGREPRMQCVHPCVIVIRIEHLYIVE